jgi:hypothetical protein
MLIGQTVFAPATGTTYYGPWFARQGDALTAVLEVIDGMGTFSLKIEVQTKNNEDADSSAATLSGSKTVSSVTTDQLSVSRAKELVRYKFTASGDGEGTDSWIHFRTNSPIWQPN